MRCCAKLYLTPYFGDYNIEDITETVIDDYWPWRKNYYKDHLEKLKGNATSTPSVQSLKMEKIAIGEVLEYAHRRASNDLLYNLNQKMEQISECFSDSRIRSLLQQGHRILNERIERLIKKYKI